MPDHVKDVYRTILERTARSLEANNMKCFIAETKADVLPIVKELLAEGETVSCGGSMSLAETGVAELLRSGAYDFLDRTGKSPEEAEEIYRRAFFADSYLTSANAVTENGELYNVDGNSNRVAAICFGPKSVIVVAGRNKVVPTLEDAVTRVKRLAAPMNTARLGCETYCKSKGECMSLSSGGCAGMTDGCKSDARICCSFVVTAYQRIKGRIKVILVNEELGF
ncbi:MAG: lactate utilization protein [Oscillospiraceae bacterium]|nr:lactate utilization protein [Oscillospiraceae bacterium]